MNEALNDLNDVLNLVISGMPSIQKCIINSAEFPVVLNLVISGMPSILIQMKNIIFVEVKSSFKPCYKWNAFNT